MLFPKPLAVYLFPSRDMSISLSNHPFLNDDDDDESMQYHSLMNGVRRGLLQCAFTTETPTVCFFCWLAMQTWQIKSAQEEIEREKIGSHSLLHFSFVYDGSRSEMVSVEVLCNVFFFLADAFYDDGDPSPNWGPGCQFESQISFLEVSYLQLYSMF